MSRWARLSIILSCASATLFPLLLTVCAPTASLTHKIVSVSELKWVTLQLAFHLRCHIVKSSDTEWRCTEESYWGSSGSFEGVTHVARIGTKDIFVFWRSDWKGWEIINNVQISRTFPRKNQAERHIFKSAPKNHEAVRYAKLEELAYLREVNVLSPQVCPWLRWLLGRTVRAQCSSICHVCHLMSGSMAPPEESQALDWMACHILQVYYVFL